MRSASHLQDTRHRASGIAPHGELKVSDPWASRQADGRGSASPHEPAGQGWASVRITVPHWRALKEHRPAKDQSQRRMGFGLDYSTAPAGYEGWAPAQVTAPHRRAVKEYRRAENHSQIAAPHRRAVKDGLRPGLRHRSGGLRRNADWPKTYRPSVTRAGEESE